MSADPITEDVVALLGRIVDRFVESYEAAAAAQGLTTVQAKVLVALDEPLPMHRIAEKLKSERSNVTGIIDRLEARGLVERRPGERDRRIKNIVATPAGAELARNFRRALGFAAEPLAALVPADRVRLRDLLARMVDAEA
ncbi:MarR family transcriptional regulator [Amycolatopsis mediterranei S699]|uniref:MarR family transcriptional regulator n=2 Tax=Amycolatopsis mediterranei TaxID=33910 RepID=A0A0H3DF08_AMYMU|nr:MarR family transcriptional regulator [Amycolatopsis mediterranei]ADJ49510.1 MarR family transcriptional regulator [Amycolatopsis mediterranei U32]AEK46482.1 MarR family transcriptional regulator [Amycolatopsis mediterranei S699]AFO81218.1 MarR family transcriptional regulator [Amycolatopsis mediterranei S699]AGT88346.1 MarR family transcriptional regulator [Amycolatopsis mediterranei RB]KDO12676.1 MarR family transcriptional regulator [Amycolatopsis mediterranei]